MKERMITFAPEGLYCSVGDFFIDPWRPVNRAIITHAHSDHARWGSKAYLAHHDSVPLLRLRLGPDGSYQGVRWGEPVRMNGVEVSLHPAGHVIGSSMIRVAYRGEVWLVTGDFKIQNDGLSGAWQPVACHYLVTECTFGLPIYRWAPAEMVAEEMRQWVHANRSAGKCSILFAYSLGKAQRVIEALAPLGLPLWAHGAVANIQETLLAAGHKLTPVKRLTPDTPKASWAGGIVIAPPSAMDTPWLKRLAPYSTGVCSGWMLVRGQARRRNVSRGFVWSDHADWDGLLQAVHACGAEKVYTTHGFTASFTRYLNEIEICSEEVKTEYGTSTDLD